MNGSHSCPHCGEDRRNLDEIRDSLKEILDTIDEKLFGEFDSQAIDETITAALKLNEVKLHPSKIIILEKLQKITGEFNDIFNDFETTGEENEISRETLYEQVKSLQKELKIELQNTVNNIFNTMEFFQSQNEISDKNKNEMK